MGEPIKCKKKKKKTSKRTISLKPHRNRHANGLAVTAGANDVDDGDVDDDQVTILSFFICRRWKGKLR